MARVTNLGERNGSKHDTRWIDPIVLQIRHLARECVYRDVDRVYCQVVHRPRSGYHPSMNIPTNMPRLKGFRYPREIIAYAVWAYHRLALSTADVENLLAARGVIVSREAVRLWVNRFGRHFADCIRRDRPRPTTNGT